MRGIAYGGMMLAALAMPTNAFAAASLWTGPCSRAAEVLKTLDIHKTLEANRFAGVRYSNIYSDAQLAKMAEDENADLGARECQLIQVLELAIDSRNYAGEDGVEHDIVSLPYVALGLLPNANDAIKCKDASKADTYEAKAGELLIANSPSPAFKIDMGKYAGKMLWQGEYRFWYDSRELSDDTCSVELQFVNFEYMWGGHSRNFGTAVVVGQDGEEETEDGRFVGQEFSIGLSDGTLITIAKQ